MPRQRPALKGDQKVQFLLDGWNLNEGIPGVGLYDRGLLNNCLAHGGIRGKYKEKMWQLIIVEDVPTEVEHFTGKSLLRSDPRVICLASEDLTYVPV